MARPKYAARRRKSSVFARLRTAVESSTFTRFSFSALGSDRPLSRAHAARLARVALADVPASPAALGTLHRRSRHAHDGIAIFHFFAKRSAPFSSVSREYECGYRSRELT